MLFYASIREHLLMTITCHFKGRQDGRPCREPRQECGRQHCSWGCWQAGQCAVSEMTFSCLFLIKKCLLLNLAYYLVQNPKTRLLIFIFNLVVEAVQERIWWHAGQPGLQDRSWLLQRLQRPLFRRCHVYVLFISMRNYDILKFKTLILYLFV